MPLAKHNIRRERSQKIVKGIVGVLASSEGTLKYPLAASKQLYNLASLSISATASRGVLTGWVGRLTKRFSQVHAVKPPGFRMTTSGAAQSEGSDIGEIVSPSTFSFNIRFTFERSAKAVCRALFK